MAKKDYYIVEKNVNKIIHDDDSYFLDPLTFKYVMSKLKGYNYKVYFPYEGSEKNIIYINNSPKIRLLEIISNTPLTHRNILGSLMGLNIDNGLFGDIIITKEHAYIIIVDRIYDLIMNELKYIGNEKIKLKEVSLDLLSDYKRNYETIEICVSSLRIDNIIAKIVGTSRDLVKRKFSQDEIILNYEICHRINYLMKENDVFSIRRNGKYRFGKVIKTTSKNNYIVSIYKYT